MFLSLESERVAPMPLWSAPDPIVLVVGDSGLRSTLTARLGLSGETVITAFDARDAKIGSTLRKRAILVLDSGLLDGGAELLDGLWGGPIVLIADAPELWPSNDHVTSLPRAGASRAIPAAISALRSAA